MSDLTLLEIPILSSINDLDSYLDKQQIKLKTYNKGEIIHKEHEYCNGIEVVLSGKLVTYALTSIGSEVVLYEYSKNDIIGADLLFSKTNYYPLDIVAYKQTTVVIIPLKIVKELLHNYTFVLEYVSAVANNSSLINKKIEMYYTKTLSENLMDYLLDLVRQQNKSTVTLPISKKDLANYLGVQRQSLFRTFKNLKNQGIIEINGREVTVKKGL